MNHWPGKRRVADAGESAANAAWLDQERESMHRKMLSAVSHDLKTPLASVIGSLEVLERMKDRLPPEKQRELFAVALQEAYRLDSFVTNILDMAKLEDGAVRAQRENVVCAVAVRQAVARMGHRLADSEIEIRDESPGLAFPSDGMLLARALHLLLDNAVKYGGARPAIVVTFGARNGRAYISVGDQGGGVPADKIDSLFCKYTRIAKQDSQVAGTGLGLAICRAIMKVLGGSVTAAANTPKGMVFSLEIPVDF